MPGRKPVRGVNRSVVESGNVTTPSTGGVKVTRPSEGPVAAMVAVKCRERASVGDSGIGGPRTQTCTGNENLPAARTGAPDGPWPVMFTTTSYGTPATNGWFGVNRSRTESVQRQIPMTVGVRVTPRGGRPITVLVGPMGRLNTSSNGPLRDGPRRSRETFAQSGAGAPAPESAS